MKAEQQKDEQGSEPGLHFRHEILPAHGDGGAWAGIIVTSRRYWLASRARRGQATSFDMTRTR